MLKLFSVALLGLAALDIHAANWPQWRGPFFNGSTSETNLPATWSKTENVVWTAPLPGMSGATPVIWNDAVFVSSPDEQKNLLLLCLDRRTGTEKWRQVVATGNRDKGRNNMASPSPVTDGRAVYVMFATGHLAAYDFEGRPLWSRDLAAEYGRFANMWIYGSSPMLFQDRLYVQVLQRSPVPADYSHALDDKPTRESFLLCLDPKTGRNLWRQVRPSDARGESQEAYSTPIPWERATGAEILVVGANYLTAHDPPTGREIWRCGGFNPNGEQHWRIVPSPVVAGEVVIGCAPKRDPVLAIKPGGQGALPEQAIAWTFKDYPSDCVTPLYYRDKLFVLDGDRQVMTCLQPGTGQVLWQGNLGVREIFRASPTGADGRIYCISENGTAVVLATEEFKVLARIPMGESPVRSTIAVAAGQLFIRTAKQLYCLGRKANP
jgi:outer membrane protein assembly factor BamB